MKPQFIFTLSFKLLRRPNMLRAFLLTQIHADFERIAADFFELRELLSAMT
jgi:hypothetical protein